MAVKKGINGYALAFFIVAGLVIVVLFMSVTARVARKKSDRIFEDFKRIDAQFDSSNRAFQAKTDSILQRIKMSDSLPLQLPDSIVHK